LIARSLLLAAVCGFVPLSGLQAQEDSAAETGYTRTYAIRADAAWLAPGRVISPAYVQISDGRIDWVSTQDARRESGGLIGGGSKPRLLEVKGTLSAGIVDAWTTMGPTAFLRDRRNDPARKVVDDLPVQVANADSSLVRQVLGAREAGVAAAYLSGGRDGLRRGVGSAVEFSALDLPIATGRATLEFGVGRAAAGGPSASYQAEELVGVFREAQDWRDSWDDYDEKLEKYQEDLEKFEEKFAKYLEEKKEHEKKAAAQGDDEKKDDGPKMPKRPKRPKEPESKLSRDLVLEALDGARQVRVEANQLSDLHRLLALQAEFDLDMVILGAYDADRIAEELAKAEIAVILPVMPDHHAEGANQRSLASRYSRLHEAGVQIALASGGAEGAELLLLARAGELVAEGVDQDAVWASLTTIPAELLGLADYGRLTSGKSATMVLFGGSSPFDASASFKAHKPR